MSHVPFVELMGHPHQQLIHDLEGGHISEITLVDGTPAGQLGGNQYLREAEHTIKVAVSGNLPRQNRLAQLRAAFRTKRQDYQTAVVRFQDPEGRNRTVKFDIDTGNPEQKNYVESYAIRQIDPPMDESSPEIVPFLADRMKARVTQERV